MKRHGIGNQRRIKHNYHSTIVFTSISTYFFCEGVRDRSHAEGGHLGSDGRNIPMEEMIELATTLLEKGMKGFRNK